MSAKPLDLKSIFADILAQNDVRGLLLISPQGEILFRQVKNRNLAQLEKEDWKTIGTCLGRMMEAEFIYAEDRVFARNTGMGYLLVWMGGLAQADMVKLSCEVASASLG